MMERLLASLRESEDFRGRVYLDTTNHLTIGYGLNLGAVSVVKGRPVVRPVNGIPRHIAELLLAFYAEHARTALDVALPWFDSLDDVRQEVLADMAYNLGAGKLLRKWPKFLGQVQRGEYHAAAANMRSTRWAKQVKGRAVRLARMMETGERDAA